MMADRCKTCGGGSVIGKLHYCESCKSLRQIGTTLVKLHLINSMLRATREDPKSSNDVVEMCELVELLVKALIQDKT